MTSKPENRFFFHANAVALAAHIRRPENAYLPSVASACLPVTGGVGYGESSGGRLDNVLSHGKAASKVFGDFVPPERAVDFTHGNHGENLLSTETRAEVTLEALEVNNGGRTVKIETLAAAQFFFLRSSPYHSSSVPLRADFREVRVDDVPLLVTTHTGLFDHHGTKQQLAEAYAHDQEFRTRHAHLFFGPKPASTHHHAIPESEGLIYSTVVTSLEFEGKPPAGVTIDGHRVRIPDFGSVYFGEFLIEEEFRRLTLVRFQLGSFQGGSVSAAEVQSNGSTWPPHRDGS